MAAPLQPNDATLSASLSANPSFDEALTAAVAEQGASTINLAHLVRASIASRTRLPSLHRYIAVGYPDLPISTKVISTIYPALGPMLAEVGIKRVSELGDYLSRTLGIQAGSEKAYAYLAMNGNRWYWPFNTLAGQKIAELIGPERVQFVLATASDEAHHTLHGHEARFPQKKAPSSTEAPAPIPSPPSISAPPPSPPLPEPVASLPLPDPVASLPLPDPVAMSSHPAPRAGPASASPLTLPSAASSGTVTQRPRPIITPSSAFTLALDAVLSAMAANEEMPVNLNDPDDAAEQASFARLLSRNPLLAREASANGVTSVDDFVFLLRRKTDTSMPPSAMKTQLIAIGDTGSIMNRFGFPFAVVNVLVDAFPDFRITSATGLSQSITTAPSAASPLPPHDVVSPVPPRADGTPTAPASSSPSQRVVLSPALPKVMLTPPATASSLPPPAGASPASLASPNAVVAASATLPSSPLPPRTQKQVRENDAFVRLLERFPALASEVEALPDRLTTLDRFVAFVRDETGTLMLAESVKGQLMIIADTGSTMNSIGKTWPVVGIIHDAFTDVSAKQPIDLFRVADDRVKIGASTSPAKSAEPAPAALPFPTESAASNGNDESSQASQRIATATATATNARHVADVFAGIFGNPSSSTEQVPPGIVAASRSVEATVPPPIIVPATPPVESLLVPATQPVISLPISQLSALSPAFAEKAKQEGIRTVQELAGFIKDQLNLKEPAAVLSRQIESLASGNLKRPDGRANPIIALMNDAFSDNGHPLDLFPTNAQANISAVVAPKSDLSRPTTLPNVADRARAEPPQRPAEPPQRNLLPPEVGTSKDLMPPRAPASVPTVDATRAPPLGVIAAEARPVPAKIDAAASADERMPPQTSTGPSLAAVAATAAQEAVTRVRTIADDPTNFFNDGYVIKGVDKALKTTERRAHDSELSALLIRAGVASKAELIRRTAAGVCLLQISIADIKRIQRRAEQLKLNALLGTARLRSKDGLENAGSAHGAQGPSRPSDTGSMHDAHRLTSPPVSRLAQFGGAQRNLSGARDAASAGGSNGKPPRDFASLDLDALSPKDISALSRFMERLVKLQGVAAVIDARAVGADMDVSTLRGVGVNAILRPTANQTEADMRPYRDAWLEMGLIRARAAGGYEMTDRFLSRFTVVFDRRLRALQSGATQAKGKANTSKMDHYRA